MQGDKPFASIATPSTTAIAPACAPSAPTVTCPRPGFTAYAKRWALGVYHGLRAPHLQRYLDEFVFRFNRRRTPQAAFASLLGLAVTHDHASYHMLIGKT